MSADDTPEGRLMRTMLGAFAAFERDLIRARTRAALAVKRARGELTGTAPYGFRAVAGRLEPHEDERATLARILDLLSKGKSLRAILNRLEFEGVRARGGRPWHLTSPARILRRRAA